MQYSTFATGKGGMPSRSVQRQHQNEASKCSLFKMVAFALQVPQHKTRTTSMVPRAIVKTTGKEEHGPTKSTHFKVSLKLNMLFMLKFNV